MSGTESPLTTLAFGMPGGWEWIAIGLVMLLLFGSRLPSVARSIGDAMREFKKGVNDISDEAKAPPRRSYESAKPPLTSGGEDPRVSHGGDPVHAEASGEAHKTHDDPPRD
jgi:sec-independent protein translocase protein TatA